MESVGVRAQPALPRLTGAVPGLRDAHKLARLCLDLPRFLRSPLEPAACAAIVARRLAIREARFLAIADRALFGWPRSPYRRLLAAAGCEPGDLAAMLAADGLEGALDRLAASGVYLTFDELKCRRPVVRGSSTFHFVDDDFDNPYIFPHIEAWSGGTRGPGTSVKMALPYFAELAASTALALEAHGLWDYAHAVWLQTFVPGFIYAKLGRATPLWLHLTAPLPPRLASASHLIAALGRLSGHPLPAPRFCAVEQPERLAAWLSEQRRLGRRICLTTYASSAVRICLRARDRGFDLRGSAFITLGEPFTAAKRAVAEAVGAHVLVRYAFTEAGIIGYGCGTPTSSDDMHLLSDSYAVIQRPRAVGNGGPEVPAFLFTSLLPYAPKLLLNVESGDYGRIERRACGCLQGAVGLDRHVSEVRSFEKLSGEGMTFLKTDLLETLEEVLPSRFGGSGADYQVIEEEGQAGILRLVLLASPGLGPVDEDELRTAFLSHLARSGATESFGTKVWDVLRTVEVRRDWPVPTRAGKILPFHLVPVAAGRPSTSD